MNTFEKPFGVVSSLNQAKYLRHSSRTVVEGGHQYSRYEVMRADELLAVDLPEDREVADKRQRARMAIRQSLAVFSSGVGKKLDSGTVETGIDELFASLGFNKQEIKLDETAIRKVAEDVITRTETFQPDDRISSSGPELMFLVNTGGSSVPDFNDKQPGFVMKSSGDLVGYRKQIGGSYVHTSGWSGHEIGMFAGLNKEAVSKLGVDKEGRVEALIRQIVDVLNDFVNGEFFKLAPGGDARIQVFFAEPHLQTERPAEAKS